ncbi:MAG: nitrite reductase [Gammaproteobacteria bacterium]|nr:nitrite/sulfite reductase [Gammaproteobacteria bacterium]PCH61525.1 MAG: nitrite reductase [Gammaproteobacteria bacterium]
MSLADFAEIDRYEESVNAFLNDEMDAARFMAYRLQHGCYGQRQDGVHMLRIKLPAGNINADQIEAVADVLENHSQHDLAHISTRQDFQIHYIPLKDTPAAMRRLAESGLTTREACGNTVRNITACPLAGVCAHEHTDINPVLNTAVERFLRHPLTQHLPRKFKISFSGCETDCAQGMIHDLGVIAVNRDGKFGFKILAGGGLGHKPHEAIVVEEFLEEKHLLASMEALISMHHKYSDRKRRAKARIKFLVGTFGAEGFLEKYQEEFERTKVAYAGRTTDPIEWKAGSSNSNMTTGAPRSVIEQKQTGFHVFPISLTLGDMTVEQLRGVTNIMRNEEINDARATQDQNLILLNVPSDRIASIRAAIANIGLSEPKIGDDIVACPGTSTCRLGITSSRVAADIVTGGKNDLRLRVSGCHNGCAQPETGDIGIYGEGKRKHGKLIPHYQMYIGGDGRSTGGLALKGPTIPSARINTAIQRLDDSYANEAAANESFYDWTRRRGMDDIKKMLFDLTEISEEDVPNILADHGESADFKVLQLGGGECAGASQDFVASRFSETAYERDCRNSFAAQNLADEAVECIEQIGLMVGQSLQFVAGQKHDDELNTVLKNLNEGPQICANLAKEFSIIAAQAQAFRTDFDTMKFNDEIASKVDTWVRNAAEACQNIDSQLDLTVSLVKKKIASEVIVDISDYTCPLHYIKARNALKEFAGGSRVSFIVDSQESQQKLCNSLIADGHQAVVDNNNDSLRVAVVKATHVGGE